LERDLIRITQIKKILSALLENHSGQTEALLEELVLHYSRNDDIDLIYDILSNSYTNTGIYWLTRYLFYIKNSKSLEKLKGLTKRNRLQTRQAAYLTIQQLPRKLKEQILLELLTYPYQDTVIFALKELRKNPTVLALPAIKDICFKSTTDKNIIKEAIKTLSATQSEESLSILKILLENKDEEIQKETIAGLSKFSQSIKKGWHIHIEKFLSSANNQIREYAYLNLIKSKDLKAEKIISRYLPKENPELKIKLLAIIRPIKTKSMFKMCLNLMLFSPSDTVSTAAYSLLSRSVTSKFMPVVKKYYENAKDRIKKNMLITLIAYCKDKDLGFKTLKQICFDENDLLLKNTAIESMGIIASKACKEFLLKIIKQNNEYSYSAFISIRENLSLDD